MHWVSSRGESPPISFVDALFAGTAPDGGLYMPERFEPLAAGTLDSLRGAGVVEVATRIGAHLLKDEITPAQLEPLVRDALDFPVPLVPVTDRVWALELFHGPTLAFKDVGARVQARLLHHFTDGTPLTILVATSGDTGSAVAQAFHRVPDTRVFVLYPAGQVSDVQEAQMASMGDNVQAISVGGTFDDCQRLVKQAFADDELRRHVWLTPANSINLGRLLPQVFYYFLLAGLRGEGDGPVVAVPSGNFGNLTAGLMARRIGLPIAKFVAATNVNDAVPAYLRTGTVSAQRVDQDRRQCDGRGRAQQFRAHKGDVRRLARRAAARRLGRGIHRRTGRGGYRRRLPPPRLRARPTWRHRVACDQRRPGARWPTGRRGCFSPPPTLPSSARWSSRRSAGPCRCRTRWLRR